MLVLPIALFIIFMILYMQFKSPPVTLFIFSGIFIALCGGMIFLFLYSQDWFMNFPFFGQALRDLFNIRKFNLSVAVWVGFLALFGVASDNGVIVATYLDEIFKRNKPKGIQEVRELVVEGGMKRALPAIMTSATTIIALIPIITSKGRGSDVMVPMALPVFGGMSFAMITLFIVPVLYSWHKERKFVARKEDKLKLVESNLAKLIGSAVAQKTARITNQIFSFHKAIGQLLKSKFVK